MIDDPMVAVAVRLVLNLLPEDDLTLDLIEEKSSAVVQMMARMGPAPQLDALVRQVEALTIVIQQGEAQSLFDPEGHIDWLAERRSEISWNFWNRYRHYLDEQTTPPPVVRRLDAVTDGILGKLEDPRRTGPWDRRGLVVGQVQSGKTMNYTGLICKAADSGYRLIVVLAGIHNSLRSQTQLRLDEGFLGFDSQYQQRSDNTESNHFIGAGRLPGHERLYAGSLTTSKESGDFKSDRAKSLALPVVDVPVLLVVKKHAGIIQYIHDWITGIQGVTDPETGRKVVKDVALLLIDDEADNASIDTSSERALDPKPINREIRRLLYAFNRSSYVGYTATPYANIYSSPDENHLEFGQDVFPRSFIDVLRAPTNYFGPERIFGIGETADDRGALPIHHTINDQMAWMPPGHKKDWLPPESKFPSSLRLAMLDFILSIAGRRARGQETAHNSMLVHVTHLQDVQSKVADQVEEVLLSIRDRMRYGEAPTELRIIDELADRWESSFVPTTSWFAETDPTVLRLTFADIEPHLLPAVEKIQVRTMNGHSKDALDYYENRKTGLSVIAVGGNKLSRGLTLEGLSVSYYLRASRMYDTLMQMGRWFGYRPFYEDLCRLYTTPDLRSWYREITIATAELQLELEEMAAQGATPKDYGLRVRTSPAGLSITAANKMRRAQRVRVSFSGAVPETVLFDVRPAVLEANAQTLDEFVAALGTKSGQPEIDANKNLIWTGVDGGDVASRFFERYKSDPMAWRVRPDLIARYIKSAISEDELTTWTVVLISNHQAKNEGRAAIYGDMTVGLTKRSLIVDGEPRQRERELRDEHRYAIRRVLSPADEVIDLSTEQRADALAETIRQYEASPGRRTSKPTSPSGPAVRAQRGVDQPLLLIYPLDNTDNVKEVEMPMVGFCVSFPFSDVAIDAEYAVNSIWRRLQDEGYITDDDEDGIAS
jgi:hypothetical protein